MSLSDPILDSLLLSGIALGSFIVCAGVIRGYYTSLDKSAQLSPVSGTRPGYSRPPGG